MSRLRHCVVVAGCAVAAVVALETLRWLRPVAQSLARDAAPIIRMDHDGSVLLETWRMHALGHGAWRIDRLHFDRTGRFLRIQKEPPDGATTLPPGVRDGVKSTRRNPWVALAHLDSRFRDESATTSTVWALDFAEGWRNGYPNPDADARTRGGRPWRNGAGPPRAWSFEDGRFVCRDLESGDVLAGFGPDGYVAGSGGGVGGRFSVDVESPTGPYAFSSYLASEGAPQDGVLLDSAAKRVFFLRAVWSQATQHVDAPKIGPLRIDVTGVSVEGPAGERPTLAAGAEAGWMWRFNEEETKAPAVPLRAGPDLVIVRATGVVYRIRLGDEERDLLLAGDATCVGTTLAPVGAPIARVRVRRFLDDGKVLAEDVDQIPVTTWGRVAALLDGVPSLVRPPLLNAASFVGPRVADYDDFYWRWFLDGVVAGGDGAAWLLGSLGVGALCAWLVRRQALLRCPTRATLWTALGAAGGPLALVWMRIAMPKSHVASCACGRRRAVHVATCPSCAADWSAPTRTGIEVFA